VFVGEVHHRFRAEQVSRWPVRMIHSLWTLMWTTLGNGSGRLRSSSFAADIGVHVKRFAGSADV
jgi:hypothetical protein